MAILFNFENKRESETMILSLLQILKIDKLKGVYIKVAEKKLNTRIIHKHDVEANWLLATGFTPKQGEIIVYDVDETHSYERMKIGDGIHNVNDLPFSQEIATDDEIVEMLMQEDVFPVVTDSDGAILADESDNILLW